MRTNTQTLVEILTVLRRCTGHVKHRIGSVQLCRCEDGAVWSPEDVWQLRAPVDELVLVGQRRVERNELDFVSAEAR